MTGNTLRTVRHYEDLGLLRPRARLGTNHRVFDEPELKRLRIITDLREISFPLAQIRELLDAREGMDKPCDAAQHAAGQLDDHIEVVRHKLKVLRRVRNELVQTREIVEECQDCEKSWDELDCPVCDVRDKHPLPDLVSILWCAS